MKADIFLAMKYERLVMRLDEVCHEIGADIGTVRNRMSAKTFPIPTRKEGEFVIADVRDVGKYLDECREAAERLHQDECSKLRNSRPLPPPISARDKERKVNHAEVGNANNAPTRAGALPLTGYLRQADLVGSRDKAIRGILPFAPATLWRRVAAKTFPAPVKLSARVTAWRVEDIRAWMDSKR
jgi:predicted DNA-binding transcriptional regulator AlpA